MLDRIITKIFSTLENVKNKSYYNICVKRGLTLGKNVVLRNNINFGSEPYLISIGDNSRVSDSVAFITHSGGQLIMRNSEGFEDTRVFGRIKIGKNTFIGSRVIIQHSVAIGDNVIIGSGSVVSSSIPDNSVYAGSPARYICTSQEYYEKKKLENVIYPRALENDRPKLDAYLKEHLPHTYKPVKK